MLGAIDRGLIDKTKVYSLGLTCLDHEVIWKAGKFYEGDKSVYKAERVNFKETSLVDLAEPYNMKRLTCVGAYLMQSKIVNGKVVTSGVDLADKWVEQNGGQFVSFDSSQFAIIRSDSEYANVCDFRYIGEENVHVDIPDGVRIIDRIFANRHIKSVNIPYSVESAYDIFRYGTYTEMPCTKLVNGPYYRFRNFDDNSAGWVLPDGSTLLGHYHGMDTPVSYSDGGLFGREYHDRHPIVWYERDDKIHEYSPISGDKILDSDVAAYHMCEHAGVESGDSCHFTAEGLRTVTDSSCTMPEEMHDLREFIRHNICCMEDKSTGRALYMFDDRDNVDFGDLTVAFYGRKNEDGDDHNIGRSAKWICESVKWHCEGYNADGTNFYGLRFDIPNGVISIDGLFANDEILKHGVEIPLSVESMSETYAHSRIEDMPDFPRGSHLTDASRMCFGCSALATVPSLPNNVSNAEDAFTDSLWANDLPIVNAKGVDAFASCARDDAIVSYDKDATTSRLYEID